MADLQPGQLEFKVHGADEGEVDASLFATKLGTLVRALKAADSAQNGGAAHFYTIVRLHTSSPTAIIRERVTPRYNGKFSLASGIGGFAACADAVTIGSPQALQYGTCVNQISRLATGSKRNFGYAEVWTANDNVVRVDPFLKERANAAVASAGIATALEIQAETRWFSGAVVGTFDGFLHFVDLRGALPEIKLTLSAGGKQIDCVCREDDVELIRGSLNKRVRITGRAIYDGRSGLPRRVEVTDIAPIGEGTDFTKWKGSFEPFTAPEWPEDAN